MTHRRSLFPLIIALLTIGLALFVAFGVSNENVSNDPSNEENVSNTSAEPVEPVTEQGYRDETGTIISTFVSAHPSLPTPDAARPDVDRAYNALLAVRVPASDRDLHMSLVTSFFLMRDGSYGDTDAFTQGWERLQQLLIDNPWLGSYESH